MCRAVCWLKTFSTFSSKRRRFCPAKRQLVADEQVGAIQVRRALVRGHLAVLVPAVAALDEQVGAVGRRDVGVDRRAAAAVEERADLRAEREVVGAVELDDVRTIGRQPAEQPEVAARIPEQLVEVPRAVGVAAGPRDAARLLLRGRRAAAGGRRRDLVGGGETRVVAVQAAQRVVGAEEPVVGEALVVAELQRVVLALRTRRVEAGRRAAASGTAARSGRGRDCR